MSNLLALTGGTKGIGLSIIRKFASAGFEIVTCARSEDKLKEMKMIITRDFAEARINYISTDLSKKEGAGEFVSFVRSLGKPVHVLVNSAGIFLPGQVHNEAEGNLEKLMQLNVLSPYHIIRGLIGKMITNGEGHIFNMCSTASITAYTNGGAYSISKYALYGMTHVLREEMKTKNIRVTAVLPGATFTDSWKGTELPPERFMKPEDVAESVFNAWNISKSSVVEEIIIRPQLGDI